MNIPLFYLLLCISFVGNTAANPDTLKKNVQACAVCHGVNGVSVNAQWPNLAGQHAPYLLKQLKEMQKGQDRQSVIMMQSLNALTLQELEDLANYYANFASAQGVASKRYVKRGERLYRGGDFKQQITACIACHGPDGRGNKEAGFPLLSGQQVGYIVQQLKSFKEKQRRNDLNGIMRSISARMDEQDMLAVAHYLSGLHG